MLAARIKRLGEGRIANDGDECHCDCSNVEAFAPVRVGDEIKPPASFEADDVEEAFDRLHFDQVATVTTESFSYASTEGPRFIIPRIAVTLPSHLL